jgi:erythromycin esterase-like protein
MNQLAAALQRLGALIATINRPGKESAAAAAESARQALQIARTDAGGAGQDAAARTRRDRLIADNLLSLREGARTVFWGHNHQVAAGRGVGAVLRQRLGRGYQAVAFEFERGAVHVKGAPGTEPRREEPWQSVERVSAPDGLGAALGRLGMDRFWLPLGAADAPPAWASQSYRHGGETIPLAGNFDMLVFLRRLTPSRLLPFVPQR